MPHKKNKGGKPIKKKFTGASGTKSHVDRRLGHAQQLSGSGFQKILDDLNEYLGIRTEHKYKGQPLENVLRLKDRKSIDVELLCGKIYKHLPLLDRGNPDCIIFTRLKKRERLIEKEDIKDRDTHDIHGIQEWTSDAEIMRKVEQLESPQHPLRKKWEKEGIKIKIDNHWADPKPHGYRAFHLNFSCKGPKDKAWSEDQEVQISDISMMYPYMMSRESYKVMRALEKHVKVDKGENQNLWSDQERVLIYPLRDYINALYEAETHALGLMDMVNYTATHKPASRNEKEAREKAEELKPLVETIINTYNYSYKDDIPALINDSDKILGNYHEFFEKEYNVVLPDHAQPLVTQKPEIE